MDLSPHPRARVGPSSAIPKKQSSLRSMLSAEDYHRIATASCTMKSGVFVPITSIWSSLNTGKSQPSGSSSTPPTPAKTLTPSKSHRKRLAHKSPTFKRLTIKSDMGKLINNAKAEDVEAWKGMGNERSSREWIGNGKPKSPHTTPHPANIPPARRTRVRTSTPNAMPKPLTNPSSNGKKSHKASGTSKSHAANNLHNNGHSHAPDTGTASLARRTSQDSTASGEETPASAPMTRKRSNNGNGSAVPSGLMHENGAAKQIIPPSPLRESSVAVMATVMEDDGGDDVEMSGGTGTGTSVKSGKKRKRPWDLVSENGGIGQDDAVPAKVRRGSEPFTTAKKAKELVASARNDFLAVPTIPTFATPSKRAATLSPPPSPSTMVFSAPTTGSTESTGRRTRNRTASLVIPSEQDTTTAIADDGSISSENDSLNNDDSGGSTDAGPPELSQSSSSYPPPFLSGRTGSGGGGSAPSLKRVASTDSYGSSSGGGAGRTRRETAIPKALRDYEMKIKV